LLEGLCGLLLSIDVIADQIRTYHSQRRRQLLQGSRVGSPFQPSQLAYGVLSYTSQGGKLTLGEA
jgi:hypothetical protein